MTHSNGNMRTVKLNDGREVCYSYAQPVAAFLPGRGYVRRGVKFSVTSSKHANGYAGKDAPELTDAEFMAAIAPLV